MSGRRGRAGDRHRGSRAAERPQRDAALVAGRCSTPRRRGSDAMPAPGPLAAHADRAQGQHRHHRAAAPPAARGSSRATCRPTTRPRSTGSARPARMMATKANMDEFAMGSSTEHSAFGRVRHPLDPDAGAGRLARGGSAALVAAGVVPAALGSETGGSVRQPASFCGVVGVKPSYGRVSRYGLVAFGSSLDCISVFGRTVDDAGRVLAAMSGLDPLDATTLDRPPMTAPAPRDRSQRPPGRPAARVFPAPISTPASRRRFDRTTRGRRGAGRGACCEVSLPHSTLRGADLLHRGAGRGGREPGPLRRRALWLAQGRARAATSGRSTRPPAARGSAPRSAAASWSAPTC